MHAVAGRLDRRRSHAKGLGPAERAELELRSMALRNTLMAKVIGRPELAKKAFGKTRTNEKIRLMALSRIAFVSAGDMAGGGLRKKLKADKKKFGNMPAFRIFSRQEVGKARDVFRQAGQGKIKSEIAKGVANRMLLEKFRVMEAVALDPVLASIFFRKAMLEIGFSNETRNEAIKAIKRLSKIKDGRVVVGFKHPVKGITLVFQHVGGKWGFIKFS